MVVQLAKTDSENGLKRDCKNDGRSDLPAPSGGDGSTAGGGRGPRTNRRLAHGISPYPTIRGREQREQELAKLPIKWSDDYGFPRLGTLKQLREALRQYPDDVISAQRAGKPPPWACELEARRNITRAIKDELAELHALNDVGALIACVETILACDTTEPIPHEHIVCAARALGTIESRVTFSEATERDIAGW